jgi:hypothetical protein
LRISFPFPERRSFNEIHAGRHAVDACGVLIDAEGVRISLARDLVEGKPGYGQF